MFSIIARSAVRSRLRLIDEGRLTIREGHSIEVFGSGSTPSATITINDDSFYSSLAFGGHIGAAESYIAGEWETDDLTALVQLLVRNRAALDSLETGLARLVQPARAWIHSVNRNTKRGSKKNILAHYDLGNELFEAFLDETMTYSAGIFTSPERTMREASIEKYDRICRKLELSPEDHVLEIGTGWGGFAIHAASTYGCRVTSTTISDAQFELAAERIEAAGVSGLVTLLKLDYRDLEGSFDKLVSIEMIEAVGHQYFEDYFEQCARLLKPTGLAAIQAITIQDRFYESARKEVDFIKKFIFPGSCIPAVSVLATAAAPTDLRIVHLEDITAHYAETLRRWRARFHANWSAITALGYGEDFKRLWDFYLAYCEGGFNEAVIGNVQIVFAKPEATVGLVSGLTARAESVA